jgi:hypothetical protein
VGDHHHLRLQRRGGPGAPRQELRLQGLGPGGDQVHVEGAVLPPLPGAVLLRPDLDSPVPVEPHEPVHGRIESRGPGEAGADGVHEDLGQGLHLGALHSLGPHLSEDGVVAPEGLGLGGRRREEEGKGQDGSDGHTKEGWDWRHGWAPETTWKEWGDEATRGAGPRGWGEDRGHPGGLSGAWACPACSDGRGAREGEQDGGRANRPDPREIPGTPGGLRRRNPRCCGCRS